MTAGGNKLADIATPTKDPEFPARMERATPIPEGNATSTPIINAEVSLLALICPVGHKVTCCQGPLCTCKSVPKTNPTQRHKDNPMISLVTPILTSFQSLITTPKVPAIIGPISGDTNMLATTFTTESSISPRPAIVLEKIMK